MMSLLSLDIVTSLARRALSEAIELGFPAAVAIVDSGAKTLLAQRDPCAGWATLEIALAKARAATAFGLSPERCADVADQTLLRIRRQDTADLLFLGGADVIRSQGVILGAIAVSGGPEEKDALCVSKAIQAMEE